MLTQKERNNLITIIAPMYDRTTGELINYNANDTYAVIEAEKVFPDTHNIIKSIDYSTREILFNTPWASSGVLNEAGDIFLTFNEWVYFLKD